MTQSVLHQYALRNTPRYTSYPTAPQFSAEVDAHDYVSWLGEIEAGARGSLYLHIPFCREMCWYCGCQTKATRRDEPIRRYVDVLLDEIAMTVAAIPHRLTVDHLHWGGGTPTLTSPEDLARVMATLRETFDIARDAEIAIEIDPRTLTAEMADTLAAEGFNRVSLGVQCFDPKVQAAINRIQDFETTVRCAEMVRDAGIEGVNIDLLYGLPYQTTRICHDTVRQAVKLNPDRLSIFGYAHVPHMRTHQKLIPEDSLPGPQARIEQAEMIAETLAEEGYVPVGIDHYARPDDALAQQQSEGRLHRNFQGYTTDSADVLLGFGASSIGKLPQGYIQNAPSTAEWMRSVQENAFAIVRGYALNADDRLRADIIERLMCDLAVDETEIQDRHGQGFPAFDLSEYEEARIIERSEHRIAIRHEYRVLARNVAAAFDAYLPASTAQHSRSI